MEFTSDEEVKTYVNRQLERVNEILDHPVSAFIRTQNLYAHLPESKMDIGHLEWKIYSGSLGGKEPNSFRYWLFRITSDYKFFFIAHGNTDAGPWSIDHAFLHGSMLDTQLVTEDGHNALYHYVAHILKTYRENYYGLS